VKRHSASLLVCFGLVLTSACDFESDPIGVGASEAIPLAVVPVFAVVPTEAEIAVLDLLRVTLRDAVDSTVVETREIVIDPDDEEWSIEMTVDVLPGQGLARSLHLETELVDTDGPTESVEWSGRTMEPFVLQSAERPLEFRQVDVFRGPLANFNLRAVTFTRASLRLVEGSTSSVRWITQGDTAGTVLYLASGDPGIISVDPSGNLQTTGIGATRVFVFGGPVQDSATVEVTEIFLPTETEVSVGIKPQLDYVSSDLFIGTFHEVNGAEAIRTPLAQLNSSLQERSGPAVILAFEAAKASYRAYGSGADGTALRYTDGPQLGVLELTLDRVANALHTAFP